MKEVSCDQRRGNVLNLLLLAFRLFSCSVASNSLWLGTVACQAPLSIGFPRQGYWSGLPCPPAEIFLTQGLNWSLFCLSHWQVDSLPLVPLFFSPSMSESLPCEFTVFSQEEYISLPKCWPCDLLWPVNWSDDMQTLRSSLRVPCCFYLLSGASACTLHMK